MRGVLKHALQIPNLQTASNPIIQSSGVSIGIIGGKKGQEIFSRLFIHFFNKTLSTNPVSTSPLLKYSLSMICKCSGIVVLVGEI